MHVFDIRRGQGFRVSANKCQFKPAAEIQYLGWTVKDGKIFASETTLNKLFTLRKPDEMSTCKDDKAKLQAVRAFNERTTAEDVDANFSM